VFKLYFVLKILPYYTVGPEQEPEPQLPEPQQNFTRSRSRIKMMQLRNTEKTAIIAKYFC
jgi:hypothetical protein